MKAGRWRILVGADAHRLDERVRANPEAAYEASFMDATTNSGDLVELIGATEQ